MRRIALAVLLLAACDKGTASPSASPATSTSTSTSTSTPTPTPTSIPTPTASAAAPDAIIAQHVLVTYRGAKRAPTTTKRTKADARVRAQEALTKIRAGTPFEDVVKEYSDDAGSVDRMGSVGKFRRDAMDPAFSAAAFALRVGEVSDVVETPFGFHVIKRTQ